MLNKLRRWLRAWHRDIGFIVVGLTLVYAISGIAVNHIEDWNPNYSITVKERSLVLAANSTEQQISKIVQKEFGIKASLKTTYWSSPNILKLFFGEETTVEVNIKNGYARFEQIRARMFLHAFNRLHLNEIKNIWTWIADLFAIALIFLAVSALFIVRGKKGVLGRGGLLVLGGIAIPVVILFIF